jgi:hypothetical protein
VIDSRGRPDATSDRIKFRVPMQLLTTVDFRAGAEQFEFSSGSCHQPGLKGVPAGAGAAGTKAHKTGTNGYRTMGTPGTKGMFSTSVDVYTNPDVPKGSILNLLLLEPLSISNFCYLNIHSSLGTNLTFFCLSTIWSYALCEFNYR